MKFQFFHLMPYTEIDRHPQENSEWPFNNRSFDPVKGQQAYQTYIDEMIMAEKCGFDSIGCNEHHMSPYGLMANCNLVASVLAYKTEKVKLGIFGNLIPLLNPIRVAEEYAMLDVMSGGRLEAGMIRGIPHEYIAYNIPGDESWERFEEAMDLILKCWTEPEPFAWEGKYYQYRAVSIWPRPIQQPHPPILMSGGSKQSAAFAAKRRLRIGIVQLTSFEEARMNIQTYKDIAHADGWEPTPDYFLLGMPTCIAETDEKARDLLREGERYFNQILLGAQRNAQDLVIQKTRYYSEEESRRERQERDLRRSKFKNQTTIEQRIEDGIVLCGSPATVVKQIKRMKAELGIGAMQLNFKVGNIPHEDVMKGLELFKEQVLPEVKHL